MAGRRSGLSLPCVPSCATSNLKHGTRTRNPRLSGLQNFATVQSTFQCFGSSHLDIISLSSAGNIERLARLHFKTRLLLVRSPPLDPRQRCIRERSSRLSRHFSSPSCQQHQPPSSSSQLQSITSLLQSPQTCVQITFRSATPAAFDSRTVRTSPNTSGTGSSRYTTVFLLETSTSTSAQMSSVIAVLTKVSSAHNVLSFRPDEESYCLVMQ